MLQSANTADPDEFECPNCAHIINIGPTADAGGRIVDGVIALLVLIALTQLTHVVSTEGIYPALIRQNGHMAAAHHYLGGVGLPTPSTPPRTQRAM